MFKLKKEGIGKEFWKSLEEDGYGLKNNQYKPDSTNGRGRPKKRRQELDVQEYFEENLKTWTKCPNMDFIYDRETFEKISPSEMKTALYKMNIYYDRDLEKAFKLYKASNVIRTGSFFEEIVKDKMGEYNPSVDYIREIFECIPINESIERDYAYSMFKKWMLGITNNI